MTISFLELSQKFLAWSKLHQAENSTLFYENYITQFNAFMAERAYNPAEGMKPFLVDEWTDSQPKWSDNYKRGAVVAINRVFNWAVKGGYIGNNPIKTAFKPPAQRRKEYCKLEDFQEMLTLSDEPFRDLLEFFWLSGCRPQEARHIEHRHINLEGGYIVFPKEESKGKRRSRRILLNTQAQEIIKKWMGKNTDGKIFRNSRNDAWTKYSICNRMGRIQKITGKKLTAYSLRHGFATRKLKEKHGHLEIAEIMGHTDGSMLAKCYSHIDDDVEYLRKILDT